MAAVTLSARAVLCVKDSSAQPSPTLQPLDSVCLSHDVLGGLGGADLMFMAEHCTAGLAHFYISVVTVANHRKKLTDQGGQLALSDCRVCLWALLDV